MNSEKKVKEYKKLISKVILHHSFLMKGWFNNLEMSHLLKESFYKHFVIKSLQASETSLSWGNEIYSSTIFCKSSWHRISNGILP